MNISSTLAAVGIAGVLAVPLAAQAAGDAAFPTKPITIIVPFPAGGVIDATARMVAEKLQARLKSPVLVDNRPGAGGTIGTALAARAPADGYTYLLGDAATQVYSPAIFKSVKYDPVKSFAPIGQISYGPLVVLVGPGNPSKTGGEFLESLKAGGDKGNYGSNGTGSTPHLATEMFKQVTGLRSAHIPFGGGPAAMTALAAGDVAYSINHIPLSLSIIATGRVKPLATTGAARSPVFPDLPTLGELGIKGYEAYSWTGLYAQAGVPVAIQQRMSGELKEVLQDADLQKKMAALGDVAFYRGPEEFSRYAAAETARWIPLIRSAGIALD